jgi:hypothetical protein
MKGAENHFVPGRFADSQGGLGHPFREAKMMHDFLACLGWTAIARRVVRGSAHGSAIADFKKIEARAFFSCSMRTNGVRRLYRDAA